MSDQSPKVSILCNTYNHEAYIAQAIEGFLMQVTDFPFEICIHDDASTDKTPDIIRSYEAKYPDQIKPIYQNVNQFTQGKLIMELNASRALGEYLAVCDGDDYWIDPHKLQRQVEVLEKDPEASLCVHAYYQKSVHSLRRMTLVQFMPCDCELTLKDLLDDFGRGYGYHTYLFRRKDLNMPEVFRTLRFTDLPRLLYSGTLGKVIYLYTPMAVYRKGVAGSFSMLLFGNPATHAQDYVRLKRFYEDFNIYTKKQYDDLLQQRIAYCELVIAIKTQDKDKVKALRNSPHLRRMSALHYRRFALETNHPRLSAFLRTLKLTFWG